MSVIGFILNVNETDYLYGSKYIYRHNVRITPGYLVDSAIKNKTVECSKSSKWNF